jgi:hypothetical protein
MSYTNPEIVKAQASTLKIQLPPYLEFLDPDDEQRKCNEFRDRVIAFQK